MRIPFTNLELKTFVINRIPGQELSILSHSTYSGVSVTEETALNCIAVYACIHLLAETLASLPLHLYRRLPRGKERATDMALYNILHNNPNPEMTSFTFRETLMAHLVGWGNAYAYIDWEDYTTVKQLIPLRPDRMQVKRDTETKKIVYQYSPINESIPTAGGFLNFPSWRIFHIPGLGFSGTQGYSPLSMVRQAIGLSLATEEFGARFFSGGAHPGGALEHPGKMSTEAKKRLKEDWEGAHSGLTNQHKTAILEEGLKFNKYSISPEDAQFLETRAFQVSEIARFFHIPPHMIGDLTKATFSNIEQQSLEFVIYTMRPWLVRWEQTINWKLLTPQESLKLFAEFLIEGLMRGDSVARSAYYKELFYIGAFSPNDVREKENMNPVPGGDEYYIPVNMLPVGQVEDQPSKHLASPELKVARKPGLERARVAASYRAVFTSAGKRIVTEETAQVLKAARKFFPKGKSLKAEGDWLGWLDSFYKGFTDFIKRQITPAVQSLAETIQPIAMDEVNAQQPVDTSQFVAEYSEAFARRYADSSVGQLKAVTKDAALNNTDLLADIEDRLDEWEERRPGKIGMNETVQLASAIAKLVFIGAGIIRLMWSATGSQSCPICQEMDGRVVGIEQRFGDSTGQVSSVGHPPLHEGCECQIVPG